MKRVRIGNGCGFWGDNLDAPVRLKTQLTPATRWGPIVQGVLVGVGIAAVIAAIMHNGGFVRRRRTSTDASAHSNDRGAT